VAGGFGDGLADQLSEFDEAVAGDGAVETGGVEDVGDERILRLELRRGRGDAALVGALVPPEPAATMIRMMIRATRPPTIHGQAFRRFFIGAGGSGGHCCCVVRG